MDEFALSPDGTRVVYTAAHNNKDVLHVADVNGKHHRNLGPGGGRARFTADARYVVFETSLGLRRVAVAGGTPAVTLAPNWPEGYITDNGVRLVFGWQELWSVVINAADHRCHGTMPTVIGTNGRDNLVGTAGDDVVAGLGGNDVISTKAGNDLVCAGSGDDRVLSGDGNDLVYGEAGADEVFGAGGNDVLVGNGEADLLEGEGGDDRLRGSGGDDSLRGGPGTDDLNGGRGDDSCNGGGGTDTGSACEAVTNIP
jgi:Ca2+-binding RTX toxin-like protein